MNKKICIILLFLSFNLFAQQEIFQFLDSKRSITVSDLNTKNLSFDVSFLEDASLNERNLYVLLPTIDEKFINVKLVPFSILSKNHTVILETSSGKKTSDHTADFSSFYVFFEGKSIGTFICFENSVLASYKYNESQFEIN